MATTVDGVDGAVDGVSWRAVSVRPCRDGAQVRVLRRLRDPASGILDYSTQWSRPMSREQMDVESRSAERALAMMYGCMECGTVKILPVLMEVHDESET